MSTPQYIYVMKDLRKVVPPSREILKGIWLSFFPGLAIMLATLSANLLSNWLRLVTDPVQRWRLEAR